MSYMNWFYKSETFQLPAIIYISYLLIIYCWGRSWYKIFSKTETFIAEENEIGQSS